MTTAAASLLAAFRDSRRRRGDTPFLWAKAEGAWRPWNWPRVEEESRAIAAWLAARGVAPGDRVVLVSENRPEWCIADLAILRAGAVTVPAYTTNTAADHAYILNHSEAKAVICSTRELQKALLPALAEAPAVRSGLFMEPPVDGPPEGLTAAVWQQVAAAPDVHPPVDYTDRLTRGDVACFIYTSGTSGHPKGVMLTHGNILADVQGAVRLLEQIGLEHEVFLSFLPLSHAYEHTAGLWFPIAIGAQIYYAEGIESLASNLLEARPTILTCVPRLFEVMRQRIDRQLRRRGGVGLRLFETAIRLGRERYERGRLGPVDAAFDRLLDVLVRRKVAARFGGRLKALVSGGAPLNYDVGIFFVALGLPLLQGYGQTEASPVIACNPPGRCKIDTVGPPLEGVEVRLAEDGEILVRGPIVMKGYWKDETATARTIREGWLHTGDVGTFDADGYLRITDRKKDIIVNSGGENISPQKVEGVLAFQPEIAQAAVYGDRRPYLVALIVPDPEFVRGFARAHGLPEEPALLAGDGKFRAAIAAAVERANERLAATERVRRFDILAEMFTIAEGLLTPTLKIRRHLVHRRYRERFEALYGAGAARGHGG